VWSRLLAQKHVGRPPGVQPDATSEWWHPLPVEQWVPEFTGRRVGRSRECLRS
jgi:hypothetical protein